MKKLTGLISLLMMSFTGISQELIPKLLEIDKLPHYCFTMEQSRLLARLLEQKKYKDSLVEHLYKYNGKFQLLTEKKDSIIFFQQGELINYAKIVVNNKREIKLFQKNISQKEKLIKRSHKHKMLLVISTVVFGFLFVGK